MQPHQHHTTLNYKSKAPLLSYSPFLLPALCVAYFTYLAAGLQLDDALIYLRYVQNFQAGAGLSYNPPENFNGLTSPAFTAAMLLASYLSSDLQLVMILLSGFFFLGAVLLGGNLLTETRLESAITASVLACCGYFYSTFGMETGLFLLLIAASLTLYRKQSPWFLITLALLIITRSEGVFLAVVLGLDYLHRERRLPDWRYLAVAFIIVCVPFIFNLFYYGALMPATGSAKIAQGRSGLWGEHWIFLNIHYLRDAFFSGSAFAQVFLCGAALTGVLMNRSSRSTWLSVLFLVLLLAFYVGLNIPNYHWYDAPFLYFLIIFACRGIWQIARLTLSQGLRTVHSAALALLLIGALMTVQKMLSFDVRGPSPAYASMGVWLRDHTPEDATVAMVEIGTVGWYSQRPIIDILGLISPYNSAFIGERQFLHWLLHYQPDFILRHEPSWAHEQSIPPLEEEGLYVERSDVHIPGLALLQRQLPKNSVAQFVSATIRNQSSLEAMWRNSEVGAPLVILEGTSLFAHAPSSLHFRLQESVSSIGIGFGVREGAQGLHGGLCFTVRRKSDNAELLQHCIAAGATLDTMHVEQEIQQPLPAGEELLFDIRCEDTCDYAWTYWSHLSLQTPAF